jgi:dienelactone hydrolase
MSTNLDPRSTPRLRQRRAVAAVIGALLALTVGSAPASATIVERDHVVNEPYEFVAGNCGYPMQVTGESRHTFRIRADAKDDRIVYVTETYAFRETWTAADGRSFSVSANAVTKDVQAVPLGGSTYRFTFNQPGQPFVIRDSSGRVVAKDRGNLSFEYTFDLETGAFEPGDFRVSGPHPLLDLDLCKAVQPLTGNDSARHQTLHPIGSTAAPSAFAEYLPPSYQTTGPGSPLLVFLHGYGETGDGTPEALDRLLDAGIPKYIDVGGWDLDRPFVVLSPQHVEEAPGFPFQDCNGSCNMFLQHARNHVQPAFCTTPDEVHDFLDYAVAHYNIDPTRIYVTGLSCGGFGTWEYLAKYGGEYAAAAIPIAGEGRPAWDTAGCALGDVALWAFHGELDDTVDPAGSIEPMTNLAGCPGVDPARAKLTVYPGLFHDGWDQAYSGSLGDDIYSWMLGITKP